MQIYVTVYWRIVSIVSINFHQPSYVAIQYSFVFYYILLCIDIYIYAYDIFIETFF